jgi:predicted nucleotidyltransferase
MNLSSDDRSLLRQYFTNRPVNKAYLFGSYARNEAIKESDVDLLVELDYSKHIGLGFIQMIFDLEMLLHRKVDLVAEDGLSKYVKPYVDKDKILIYERAT